ncbi:unnamed protein product [Protopolystoma xenopodis]|uniref:Uncharacterized protein n=1 Tax=Protopolystoma xenopodis TaxID=117903 RepID=A0A448XJR1_9PLAT|nr:unnamed protein product [Protopolystoma xenopodis]
MRQRETFFERVDARTEVELRLTHSTAGSDRGELQFLVAKSSGIADGLALVNVSASLETAAQRGLAVVAVVLEAGVGVAQAKPRNLPKCVRVESSGVDSSRGGKFVTLRPLARTVATL